MTAITRTIRTWHRPLVCFAVLMTGLAVVSVVGYVVDDRVLVGVPIWAKPLKFSISFTVYALTLAWLLSQLHRPRVRRIAWWAGTALAAASTLEMAAIVLQVVRGRQSHFNFSTPFDTAVFSAMGAVVAVIFLSTVLAAVLVLIEPPVADRATTWAIRLGLGLSVAGMSVGFLMLRPTAAQAAQGGDGPLRGAHSVGVADGGSSIPLLGWSTTGGDLRISHFVGMHALQALPLLAVALLLVPWGAPLSSATRTRVVLLGAFAYACVFALTLWQALRGQPLLRPDGLTLVAAALVVVATTVAALGIARVSRRPVVTT